MTKWLVPLGFVALAAIGLSAQPPQRNGGTSDADYLGCRVLHKDAAVNTAVTLISLTPPQGQYVYLCSWDWTASQDATATVQTNAQWTTVNLGGLSVEYSQAATANAYASGAYNYTRPLKASQENLPIQIASPALAAHTAYSVNMYYFFAP